MKSHIPVLLLAVAIPSILRAQEVKPAEPVPVAPAQPVSTPPPAPVPTPEPTPTPAPTPEPTPPDTRGLINDLNEQEIDQAIQNIQSNFLNSDRTDGKELRRATLEGLIRRLTPGASIVSTSAGSNSAKSAPFLAEILDAHVGYIRFGTMDRESLAQMDAALDNFKEKKLGALVLDLRDTPPSTDFDLAAEFARRFCPKGKLLFSIQKPSAKQERILTSNQDPAFSGILVILTDRNTAGGAEALAATLRLNAHAMIVGDQTSGEAVEFSDLRLGDDKVLRVAVAQVTLRESGPIFPEGVKPDIAAALDPGVQREIFRLSAEKGVSQFVFEKERPRMNEAALVANTNPEINPGAADRGNGNQLWDSVLQRAVDLVTAIGFYSDRKE